MSAFPEVPVLSCAAVGPAAVDFSGILAWAKINYLCTYDLYGPVRKVFDAGR